MPGKVFMFTRTQLNRVTRTAGRLAGGRALARSLVDLFSLLNLLGLLGLPGLLKLVFGRLRMIFLVMSFFVKKIYLIETGKISSIF